MGAAAIDAVWEAVDELHDQAAQAEDKATELLVLSMVADDVPVDGITQGEAQAKLEQAMANNHWFDDEGREYVGGSAPPPPRGTPSRAATDAVIQNEFADQLSEMLGDDDLGVMVPSQHGQPPQRVVPFDEEDRAFPEVRARSGKSTFPVKQKLKALGCRWSQKRNAWVAPDAATAQNGMQIANAFWQANPNHDPWTLEGDPQPVPQQNKRKRMPKVNVEIDFVVADEISEKAARVSAAFTAVQTAAVLQAADDVQLTHELERRGYTVRKIPESELLREALAAEGETGGHLLAATDDIFNELEQDEE